MNEPIHPNGAKELRTEDEEAWIEKFQEAASKADECTQHLDEQDRVTLPLDWSCAFRLFIGSPFLACPWRPGIILYVPERLWKRFKRVEMASFKPLGRIQAFEDLILKAKAITLQRAGKRRRLPTKQAHRQLVGLVTSSPVSIRFGRYWFVLAAWASHGLPNSE